MLLGRCGDNEVLIWAIADVREEHLPAEARRKQQQQIKNNNNNNKTTVCKLIENSMVNRFFFKNTRLLKS